MAGAALPGELGVAPDAAEPNDGAVAGMERAGRLTGQRFFGDHDWYREGAEELVHTQDKLQGFWRGALFEELAANVAGAPPVRPKPLTSDELLGLFAADVVGAGVQLEPATQADMRGTTYVERKSLEIIYDEV